MPLALGPRLNLPAYYDPRPLSRITVRRPPGEPALLPALEPARDLDLAPGEAPRYFWPSPKKVFLYIFNKTLIKYNI